MADVSLAIQPKSDQLNYVDVSGGRELIITIEAVTVQNIDQQQVSVFYGDAKKAYKPSKGMIRLMADVWGTETDKWIGHSIKLWGDETVKWAGKEIGGIRIKALTGIPVGGRKLFVTISRNLRRQQHMEHLETPVRQVTKEDQVWVDAARADITVLEQIGNEIYKTFIKNLI
jgi:hypothetical protein